LRKDLGVKARIYAAAGVPEYWVVDVGHGIVHLHREPSVDGYGEVVVHGAGAVLDACGVEVRVGELLAGLD
jgi:Uma2 family endonuclease